MARRGGSAVAVLICGLWLAVCLRHCCGQLSSSTTAAPSVSVSAVWASSVYYEDCVGKEHNTTFPKLDACNWCRCWDGLIYCTMLPCAESCSLVEPAECVDGHSSLTHWIADDACNICACDCSLIFCSPVVCDGSGPDPAGCHGGHTNDTWWLKESDRCTACLCWNSDIHCMISSCSLPWDGLDCEGGHYDGSVWPHDDGCNICQCFNGTIECTITDCGYIGENRCSDGHFNGSIWVADDGCNHCTCINGRLICTDAVCETDCGFGHAHGSYWVYECNLCQCWHGVTYCTSNPDCEPVPSFSSVVLMSSSPVISLSSVPIERLCGNQRVDYNEECDGTDFCTSDCLCVDGYAPMIPAELECQKVVGFSMSLEAILITIAAFAVGILLTIGLVVLVHIVKYFNATPEVTTKYVDAQDEPSPSPATAQKRPGSKRDSKMIEMDDWDRLEKAGMAQGARKMSISRTESGLGVQQWSEGGKSAY